MSLSPGLGSSRLHGRLAQNRESDRRMPTQTSGALGSSRYHALATPWRRVITLAWYRRPGSGSDAATGPTMPGPPRRRVCVSHSERFQDENGEPEAEADENDQDGAEGRKRDHRDTTRQHSPGKRNERGLWPEGPDRPEGRLRNKQPADSSVQASPKPSPLGGLDTSVPTPNHLIRLSSLRDPEEGQPAPTLPPKLKRAASLLKRRRSQHLLEQQLVRVTIADEPHGAMILSVPGRDSNRTGARRALGTTTRSRHRCDRGSVTGRARGRSVVDRETQRPRCQARDKSSARVVDEIPEQVAH
jgi:hypothetical protein